MNRIQFTALSLALAMLVVLPGCGGGDSVESVMKDANSTNIARLTNLYSRHQLQHQGKGPVDEAAFKKYITEQPPATLKRMGVDNAAIDDLFVSDRDGENLEVMYDVQSATRGSNDAIIFETAGVEGIKMVGFTSTAIREIESEDDYQKLLAGETVSFETSGDQSQANLPTGAAR